MAARWHAIRCAVLDPPLHPPFLEATVDWLSELAHSVIHPRLEDGERAPRWHTRRPESTTAPAGAVLLSFEGGASVLSELSACCLLSAETLQSPGDQCPLNPHLAIPFKQALSHIVCGRMAQSRQTSPVDMEGPPPYDDAMVISPFHYVPVAHASVSECGRVPRELAFPGVARMNLCTLEQELAAQTCVDALIFLSGSLECSVP